jgi:ACS family hexuronate transporter-like MFS transporter
MTDGVWWFYLFWAPAYFSDQFNYGSNTTMGKMLILYSILS